MEIIKKIKIISVIEAIWQSYIWLNNIHSIMTSKIISLSVKVNSTLFCSSANNNFKWINNIIYLEFSGSLVFSNEYLFVTSISNFPKLQMIQTIIRTTFFQRDFSQMFQPWGRKIYT